MDPKDRPNLRGRFAALGQSMAESGVSLAVYSHCPNFQYLTGFLPGWRDGRDHLPAREALIVPASGRPVLLTDRSPDAMGSAGDLETLVDVRKTAELEAAVRGAVETAAGKGSRTAGGIAVGRELKGDVWLAVLSASGGRDLVPGWNLIDRFRAVKDRYEIAALRRAAALTDEAVKQAVRGIREGITMRELQLEIEMHGRRLGASGVSFPPVSGFIHETGRETGSIFSYDPEEGLRRGTTVFFDVGFVLDGYCSDWGRSVYFGDPGREVMDAYTALNHAVVNAVRRLVPGTTRAADVFGLIEEELEPSGFADRLRARLPGRSVGHQIGVEVHENPWLDPGYDDILVPGMVMCLEPKLWRDGGYYLRVEDMVLISEDGAEILTGFDRSLFTLG